MGIIELILGVIILIIIANLVLKFIPIPTSIGGIIVLIIIIYLVFRVIG